ncbi:hypothetical protein B0H65DRAFT_48561 [Neurospora tetraspora]|uniref:Uncharacterized protein n=1 Tax=Neurospora tetraspora TaxID=94610 RepID=A0AAE0MWF9_9PEZI|nr:hypothetical protein B0H65DRAFT_48561 [Neurospora tetraspora]
MPRPIEADVHSAFMEFRNAADEKCMSVQCLFCHQVRAKNTTRQKQHLAQCTQYLAQHPEAAAAIKSSLEQHAQGHDGSAHVSHVSAGHGGVSHGPAGHGHGHGSGQDNGGNNANLNAGNQLQNQHSAAANAGATSVYPEPTSLDPHQHTNLGFTPNARINGTSTPHGTGTPIPQHIRPMSGASSAPPAKRQKTKQTNPNLPEIPLAEVHAAFVEFQAKEGDKCLSAKCIYCNQVRAKNTSRQREHLLQCPGYQATMKDRIPANNLLHHFDDDDVAASLALPTPTLELDFRMSIRVKPKINIGNGTYGRQSWISCIGGQWAGRWGKGNVLANGQDTQTSFKETETKIDARYLIQTNDDHPALIICKVEGWWVGEKEIMERLQDPVAADNVAANRYKLRVTIKLETGDERYEELNSGVWVGSGCRRGAEIVYDAYRVN